MYTTFCSAANSLSQLYTQAQKLAFQAGERHGMIHPSQNGELSLDRSMVMAFLMLIVALIISKEIVDDEIRSLLLPYGISFVGKLSGCLASIINNDLLLQFMHRYRQLSEQILSMDHDNEANGEITYPLSQKEEVYSTFFPQKSGHGGSQEVPIHICCYFGSKTFLTDLILNCITVREARNEPSSGRGGRGGCGVGHGGGRGGGQFRNFSSNEGFYNNGFTGGSNLGEDGEVGRPSERGRGGYGGPHPPYHGGRRGGYGNGETGDTQRPRRQFERRSGTGRGTELKRDGAGRGNWGTPTDETFIQCIQVLFLSREPWVNYDSVICLWVLITAGGGCVTYVTPKWSH